MRAGRILGLLASASLAIDVYAAARFQRREESSALDALEVAANSRLPNIPFPKEISNSTKTLLQFMTIWGEAEVASMTETLDKISRHATGFTEFGLWSEANVSSILKNHLAENELVLNYTIGLLHQYEVPLIPEACTYKSPLSGLSINRDVLVLEQLNTLYIDSLQDASKTVGESGDSALLPILWSIATSKAEQNGFYRLFAFGEFPSERAFLTSIPPALAYSSFSQILRKCPFELDEILPVSAPLFEDWIVRGESFTYCANLTKTPSDLSKLHLSIMVGDQLPIIIPVRNVETNGTIIFFDSDYPQKQAILEGMVIVALVDGGSSSSVDAVAGNTLAASFIQPEQKLNAEPPSPDDVICPRAGGTLFWDFISP